MHLSATAITALLLVAGVGSLAQAAPLSAGDRASIIASPDQTIDVSQGTAGDGSVRPGDGSVKPGDGSVKPADTRYAH